jgi:copper chaperone CopZ
MMIRSLSLTILLAGATLVGCGGVAEKPAAPAVKTVRTVGADGVEVFQVALKLPNMACENCAGTIRNELAAINGVSDITTDPKTKLCTFKFVNKNKIDLKAKLTELSKKTSELEEWSLIEG